jgi:hypothetical protein
MKSCWPMSVDQQLFLEKAPIKKRGKSPHFVHISRRSLCAGEGDGLFVEGLDVEGLGGELVDGEDLEDVGQRGEKIFFVMILKF